MEKHCEETIGVDINKEAVDYVRDKGVSDNVFFADLTEAWPSILAEKSLNMLF